MSSKTLELGKQFRTVSLRVDEPSNADNRIIEGVSICSEEPCDRWFGSEILSHAPGAIRLGRIESNAAPLLFNHDPDKLLGKVMNPRIDGGKLRVDLKFSTSEEGQEALAQLRDGILTECSIGYIVYKFEVDEEAGTYTATDWEIFENSMVTIPADATVGAGRSETSDKRQVPCVKFDSKTETAHKRATDQAMSDEIKPTTEPKIDVVREREDAAKAERKRSNDIKSYINAFKVDHMREDVRALGERAIEDGSSFEAFEKSVMSEWRKSPELSATRHAEIGMSKKELKDFSILRAIRSIATNGRLEGLEKEACAAALQSSGRGLKSQMGFMLPDDVINHSFRDVHGLSGRAQIAGSATAGGFTVPTMQGSMIEYLRNKTVLGQAGITTLSGLQGDVALPIQTGGSTAYWVGETAALTDSQATFGQKQLTPHRLGATIPLSTQFIAQSALPAEAFARNELMTVLAIELDRAGLLGSGVLGQPTGVANTTTNATVTYGGAADWSDVVEHETGIAVDNADIGAMAFILSAATVGKWKTKLRDSVAGAGYLISDNMTANGYNVIRTNQISSANQSFFGVWSQLILGIWAGLEIIVDPYSLAKSGQVQVTAQMLADYMVRQANAFNVSTDSAAQ